jgi:pimeloyl-ACP methyl ester carboxylesterase
MQSRSAKSFALAAVAVLWAWPASGQTEKGKHKQKPPLVLEEHGQFIVGGELVRPTINSTTREPPHPPPLDHRDILVGQAYVEYFIPANKKHRHLPIIMTHSARAGINWLTTPDGREGWAHYFVRRGFPAYVVEPPGVGRAGFPVDQFNRVREGLDPPSSQPRLRHGDSSEWIAFWQGPAPRVPGDGITYGYQMPNDEKSYKHWLQYSSMPGGPVPGGNQPAFIALLEKLGPVIWVGWSAGGNLGQTLAVARPELFAAFIGIEAGCPANNPTVVKALAHNRIPALFVEGPTYIGTFGSTNCQAGANAINAAGGTATDVYLPDIGIFGNSHMMMWELNSDEIARVVVDWIDRHVGKKPKKEKGK